MRLFKDKRGNFPDIQDYLVNSLFIGIALLIGFTILLNFNTQVNLNGEIPAEGKLASDNYNSIFFKFDYITPVILLGFLAFSLIAARLIPSTSKFIIIPIFSMFLFPLVSMALVNFWDGFSAGSGFSGAISNLFFTNFILDNLVIISLLYAFLIGIALYTKNEVSI